MEKNNAIVLLKNRYQHSKGVSKLLTEIILRDLDSIMSMTIKDLAEKANVAQSSVVRFYQDLGFQDYADFKISIAKNLEQQQSLQNTKINKSDTLLQIIEKTASISIQAIKDSVASIDMDVFEETIKVLKSAKRIDFYGLGSSSMLVHDCYYRLMRMGYPCFFATDPHIMRTSANALGKHCVAFGISYTGRSKDTIRALEIAKSRDAKTICLTGFDGSPITKIVDLSMLCISNETKSLGESYSNTIAQKVILDSIYHCLIAKTSLKQKTEELHQLLEETRI